MYHQMPLPLFEEMSAETNRPFTIHVRSQARQGNTLAQAIAGFNAYIAEEDRPPESQKAIRRDLESLGRTVGMNLPVEAISTADLAAWLDTLIQTSRPATVQRRLSTARIFFAWLVQNGVRADNPARALRCDPVERPTPTILDTAQTERLLTVVREWWLTGDPRPYLLLSLLLQTGIKRGELMAIQLTDIALSPPPPRLTVQCRAAHRRRILRLPDDFAQALEDYQRIYTPQEKLVTVSTRYVDLIVRTAGQAAGIANLSCTTLRWTAAARA